jgi:hypothetical protein
LIARTILTTKKDLSSIITPQKVNTIFDQNLVNVQLYLGKPKLNKHYEEENNGYNSPEDMFEVKTKLTEYTDQQVRSPLFSGDRKVTYFTETLPSNEISDNSPSSKNESKVAKLEPIWIEANTVHINQVSEIPQNMYFSEGQHKSMSFGRDPEATNKSNHNASRIIVINQKKKGYPVTSHSANRMKKVENSHSLK